MIVLTLKFLTFIDAVLKPLFQRIRNHPALIGIEIIDDVYQQLNDLRTFVNSSNEQCPYKTNLSEDIKNEIYLLSYQIKILRKIFNNDIPIGVGFNANCQLCMPLLTIPECLDSQLPDFITIRSINNASMNQYYSHFKLEKEYQQWLTQNPQIKIPGIFYTIYASNEGDRVNVPAEIEKILYKYVIGYFIPRTK